MPGRFPLAVRAGTARRRGRPVRPAGAILAAKTLLAATLWVASAPAAATGQAALHGRVIDSETGRPIRGATVDIQPGPPPLTTDSLGRFEALGIPAGEAEITIRRIGYDPHRSTIVLQPDDDVDRVFPLDFTGYRLPDLTVQARADEIMPRYTDFERRRMRGQGAFFRWDDLLKSPFGSVGDALRTVRGVRIECNQQTFECLAVMARSPQCHPTWWIDGVQVRSFHENTPIRDIYGIEVYRGAGEVPGEFTGSDAACGVIVLWTKSRPYR